LRAHATRDKDDALEYVGAIQDVTHQRRSDDAISRLQSELTHVARVTSLGVLTASIAHEVNQPLAALMTNAGTAVRMLTAEPPNVRGALERTQRVVRSAERASEVIARLRALFARDPAVTEEVDLNDAAREVVALSMAELQRSRVLVRLDLRDDLPAVPGDRVQLQQVMLNLILNARDAMSTIEDHPRMLTVRTDRRSDAVLLSVQDAGVGLDPSAHDRLFEAFYTTKQGGMGIGLSVSQSIIERHGGRLWAVGNPGQGSTFSFVIPCELGSLDQMSGATPSASVGAELDAAQDLRST
jgi:C4-dicarboxylate-specific signal transduction histidine kinase